MKNRQLSHVNKLVNVNNNKGIKFLHQAASPGSHCPMHTTLALIKNIANVSTLVVGMPECGYYSRYVIDDPYGSNGELHYVYEMDSNEVVFGCKEGVVQAIKEMDSEGAKIILLIVTCVPELIGEYIEGIIKEVQGNIHAKLIYTDVAHFKRNGYQAGFFETIAKLVEAVDVKQEKVEEIKGFVNILGVSNSEEMNLFKEVLVDRGYVINVVDLHLSMEAIERAVNGKMSIVLSPKMTKLAKQLNEKHSIPYICLHNVYAPTEIAKAYKMIMDILEIDECSGLEVLHENACKLQDQCHAILKDKKFITTSAELDAIPFAAFLCSLNMIPVLLHIEEFYEENKEFSSKILNYGIDPHVCYISDSAKLIEVLEEEEISLSFGECEGLEGEKIISGMELNKMIHLSGYDRTIYLLNSIVKQLHSQERGSIAYGII